MMPTGVPPLSTTAGLSTAAGWRPRGEGQRRNSRLMTSPASTAVAMLVRLISALRKWGRDNDAGMSTAEYAVGTIAAVAFAAVLYKIVRSDAVSSALSAIVTSALHAL